jgi:hypothetical protein
MFKCLEQPAHSHKSQFRPELNRRDIAGGDKVKLHGQKTQIQSYRLGMPAQLGCNALAREATI